MRLHLRRHFDQKPYECDVDGCKERFVSGAILKMHVEKKHLNKKKLVKRNLSNKIGNEYFSHKFIKIMRDIFLIPTFSRAVQKYLNSGQIKNVNFKRFQLLIFLIIGKKFQNCR